MVPYGLLFYLSDDFTEHDVVRLKQSIKRLAEIGEWSLGPPAFIDHVEQPDTGNPDDQPIRTVGGFLNMNRLSHALNTEVEKAHYGEAKRVVDAMKEFASHTGCEIEFELGGEIVGDVRDGKASKSIEIGLLDEWRKALGIDDSS